MLRLDKINISVAKFVQSRFSLGDMTPPPQQQPVAMMEVNPGNDINATIAAVARDIIELVKADVPDLDEKMLVEKISSIVNAGLPKCLSNNKYLRALELPGETFAGGDQNSAMVIVSVATSYTAVALGFTLPTAK